MNWLAVDIGGANIKLADGRGYATARSFALWQHPERLANQLRAAIAEAPECDHLAIAMTGELADCFTSKTEGVNHILDAVDQAADGRHTRVYLTDGKMVAPSVARTRPLAAAAANWHALACFAARYVGQQPGLVIDIGSTTTDIIPLREERPIYSGQTDLDRLCNGQLVYTGVERSPVCSIVRTLPIRNRDCPVAQELFATTRDVYLILKDAPEAPDDRHTADHGPATIEAAARRLGRMLCADSSEYGSRDAGAWAQEIARKQTGMILKAVRSVLSDVVLEPAAIVLAGQGDFLGRRVIERLGGKCPIVSLVQQLGPDISRCATAHALAILAREAVTNRE